MNSTLKEAAIESGLIDPKEHSMLLADLDHWARQAGIPEKFVFSSLTDYSEDPQELRYVSSLLEPDLEHVGMIYVGAVPGASVNERMMAIAGVCLRNYINAKVMVLYDVLEALRNGDMPSPTVLLIPDFYDGSSIAEWQSSGLLGLLYKRQQEGKQTVLYVNNIKTMATDYGKPFLTHIQGKFLPIGN